jgi:hypothetical protein
MTPEEQRQMQMAATALRRGDGVSMQTHAAMKEAGVGPYEGMPAAPAPAPGYSVGASAPGQVDLEQRQRNASAAKLGLPPGRNYTDQEILAATLRQRRPAPQ